MKYFEFLIITIQVWCSCVDKKLLVTYVWTLGCLRTIPRPFFLCKVGSFFFIFVWDTAQPRLGMRGLIIEVYKRNLLETNRTGLVWVRGGELHLRLLRDISYSIRYAAKTKTRQKFWAIHQSCMIYIIILIRMRISLYTYVINGSRTPTKSLGGGGGVIANSFRSLCAFPDEGRTAACRHFFTKVIIYIAARPSPTVLPWTRYTRIIAYNCISSIWCTRCALGVNVRS